MAHPLHIHTYRQGLRIGAERFQKLHYDTRDIHVGPTSENITCEGGKNMDAAKGKQCGTEKEFYSQTDVFLCEQR
jgi:hypothetical protein